MRAPEKESPAPVVATGNGAKLDPAEQQINLETKQPGRQKQPQAIARRFGICHAVYVRDAGTISRVGLFDSLQGAQIAAADLNEIFAMGQI